MRHGWKAQRDTQQQRDIQYKAKDRRKVEIRSMDWELISEQVLRHVEECLPRPPSSTAVNLDSSETPPGSYPSSVHADPARPVESQTINRSHSDNAALSTGGKSGKCWGLACSDTGSPAVGNHSFEAGGSRKLDAIVDRLQQQQALVDHALRIQHHDVGRGLAEVRAVLRRMELVEGHTTARDEDMGNLAIASSKTEGMMVTLQGRQDQLDAKACNLRDTLSTVERRCMCAETALHGAVSHGQVIDVIRTILGPFQEEVEKRLLHLEHELSGLNDAFTKASRDGGHGIPAATEKVLDDMERQSEARGAQVKAWAEGVLAAESRRRDAAATALNHQLEELARETKANTCRICQIEAECKKLASSTSALSQRQHVIQNEEAPSIRRELQDTERGLQRRIEEARLSDIRRMDEVFGEVKRERQARVEEYREVSKDVLNVKQSVLETDHRHGSTEDRICRLEDSVARDVDINLQTRKSVDSMGDTLKDLRLEIQAMHGATVRIAQQVSKSDLKTPRPHPVHDAGPLSVAGTPTTRSLGQPNCPPRMLLPESRRFLPTSTIDGSGEQRIDALSTKGASNLTRPMAPSTKREGAGASAARSLIPDSKPHEAPLSEPDCRVVLPRDPAPPTGRDTPSTQEESNGRDTSIHGERPAEGSKQESVAERGGVDDVKPIDDHERLSTKFSSDHEGGGTCPGVLYSKQNRNIQGKMCAGGTNTLRQAQLTDSTAILPLPPGPQLATLDDTRDTRSARNPGNNQQIGEERADAMTELSHPPSKEAFMYPVPKTPSSPLSSGTANTFANSNFVTTQLTSSGAPTVPSFTATSQEVDAGSTSPGTLKIPGSSSPSIHIAKAAVSNADERGVAGNASTTSQADAGLSAELDSDSSFSADDIQTERRPSTFGKEEKANNPKGKAVSKMTGVPPGVREVRASVHRAVASTSAKHPRERKSLCEGLKRDATSQLPPAPSLAAATGTRRNSTGHRATTGPAPVSSRERLGPNDAGGTSAQCEFCLRRYLRTAMASHVQICELRLVRCPYQCGAKVLVRNLEKHKNTCSLRKETAGGKGEKGTASNSLAPSTTFADHDSAHTAASKPVIAHIPMPGDAEFSTGVGYAAQMGAQRARAVVPEGADRTVTCMRCHESLPFHLVPSHSPKCKGGDGGFPTPGPASAHSSPAAAKAVTGGSPTFSLPSSSRRLMDVSGLVTESRASVTAAATYPVGGGVTPSSLPPSIYTARGFPTPSPSPLSPTLESQKARQPSARIEGAVPTPVVGVPRSPPRSSDVRTWGTRQVTSWLRESMRPPRADVISRFHDSGIDGPALLELTDRDLLHPTEGVGITDADTRRQILKAVDALVD